MATFAFIGGSTSPTGSAFAYLPMGAWSSPSVDPPPPEPLIDSVTALSPTTIEITWDTPMSDDVDLIDAGNYSVGNADIARVTRIDEDTVHLHLDDPLPPGAHAVTASGMTSTAGGTAAAASSVTASRRIRTWLQGSHYQPVAATVRLTIDPSGAATTHDWAVTAGTHYKSLDLLIASWQAALGSAAWLEVVPDATAHRGFLRVNTAGGETYSIAWSHAGDGTLLRNRLGESGNVSGRVTATVWSSPVLACWYGWHGATRLQRRATKPVVGRRALLSGTLESSHGAIPNETGTIELAVSLRCGPPPDADLDADCLEALGEWLDELWTESSGGEPWSIYHLPDDEETPERYEVAFAGDVVDVAPSRVGGVPLALWDVELALVADVAP